MAIAPQPSPGTFKNSFKVRNYKEQIVFKCDKILMNIKFNN